jgi:4-amino-4-deoxy-L-arabinose transferase-like glycosyltransferase
LPLLRKHSTLTVLLIALIPLLGWWTYGLFDLDEGFYAAVTSEMNRRGEWITPFYNGHPWFEKPILLYWLAKPCLALFGEAFGPRLPDIVATLATYALVLWFGRRRLGDRAAIFSTLVLASCPLVVALGRMMMTDPLLMFCVSAALLTFWESLGRDWRWRVVSAVCLGLGVLAKGPIAGIIFLPPVAWTYWRQPLLRGSFKGGWIIGIVAFSVVVASWYVPAYLADGKVFVNDFLIRQNFGRFSGGDEAHTVAGIQNLVFYPVIILICYLPWSIFLPVAWKKTEATPLNGFLKAWFLTVLIFFTITKAKLPHYMLPLSAPIALLVGQYLVEWTREKKHPLAWPVGSLAVVTFLANFGFYSYYHGIRIGPLEVPGFHAEVHLVARYVHDHASPLDSVVEYKIGRQQVDRGTGHLKIQQTLQPSVLLYLNRDTLETDDFAQALALRNKVWIITRYDRIGPTDEAAAGGRLHRINLKTANDLFRLYVLDSASEPIGSGKLKAGGAKR